MHPVKWFVCTLLVVASLALPSLASAQTADIVGRVTDNSGGVLPGATVTVENIGTRDVRTAVTSDTGDYVFTLLPIGTYTVKIELQGFSAYSLARGPDERRPHSRRREVERRDRHRDRGSHG